jgi:hypothetical protein
MFENYSFAISLLCLAWAIGHSLNLLFEGLSEDSLRSKFNQFERSPKKRVAATR